MEPTDASEDGKHNSSLFSIEAFLNNLSTTVNESISCSFRRWAALVSRRPYSVICFTTIFALIWAAVLYAKFETELDGADLFTPDDARSFADQDYAERYYTFNGERARVLSIKKQTSTSEQSCEGKLLLRNEAVARKSIQEFYRVYEEIRETEVSYKGVSYRLEDICIRPSSNSSCLLTSILDLWNYDAEIIMSEDFKPLEDINRRGTLLDRFNLPLEIDSYLGKPGNRQCEPNNLRSSNVESFAMTLLYEYEREEVNGAEIDPESQEWIEGIADRLREISKTMDLDSYVADWNAVNRATEEQAWKDLGLLVVGFMLVTIYTNVVLYKNSSLACKMHLSFASLNAIGFSLWSAYGIAQLLGVKFNMVLTVLPFLILGLGLDDTFVLIGAYQKVQYDLPVEEKIAQTLEQAGSSIFVTSATDCCAFLLGLYTTLPAMRAFAVYASLAIFFDFMFQVTFFIAFLVLDARREARYRNGSPVYGIRCFFVENPCEESLIDVEEAREQRENEMAVSTFSSSPAQGERSELPNPDSHPDPDPNLKKQKSAWRKIFGAGEFDPSNPSFSTKLVGTYIPSVTLHPAGRVVVIGVECLLILFSIYGCTRVKMDFNYIDMFTPDSSPLKTAFDLESEYFYGDQVFLSVYTKEAAEGDYFYHQDELVALKAAIESNPYVVPPVHSWYEGYSQWLKGQSGYAEQLVDGSAPDALSFNMWLQEYLGGAGSFYKDDVVFSEDSMPRAISSRIMCSSVDIVDGKQSIRMLDSIRASIQNAAPSLDPIAYSVAFLFFDGLRVIAWETVRNVVIAGIGVFAMNVIVLACVRTAAIVVSMVALTDIVLFGYMSYVDLYVNFATAIGFVMAVGIAVDYSAHIAHSFLILPGDRLERAKGALMHIGGEVASGAFTTLLGILSLGFAGQYVLVTFFKTILAIVITGAWHGLILLPVILSFIGSKSYLSRSEKQSMNATSDCKVAAIHDSQC